MKWLRGATMTDDRDDATKNGESDAGVLGFTQKKRASAWLRKRQAGLFIALMLVIALLLGIFIGNQQVDAPTIEDGATPSASTKLDQKRADVIEPPTSECSAGKALFLDKEFGAKFCYPSSWGVASLRDAKLAPTDTGQRQSIVFSAEPRITVGGVSQDWTTTVGRGGACLDPSNAAPDMTRYNTEWHDLLGEGPSVEFATRSLQSREGGYSVIETVSSTLQDGVCAQGFKQTNSSRYRVVSAQYYQALSPSDGVSTPAQHMATPNVLFNERLRADFDDLIADIRAVP